MNRTNQIARKVTVLIYIYRIIAFLLIIIAFIYILQKNTLKWHSFDIKDIQIT